MKLLVPVVLLSALLSPIPICADDFFVEKVEPILKARCFECHAHGQAIEGGLALDSKSGWVKGGKSGPAVIPHKPEASLLIKAISHVEVDLKMPPGKRMAVAEIAVLTEWVKRGAVDPRVIPSHRAEIATPDEWDSEFKRRLDWWSLKPLRVVQPPLVDDVTWSREPIDRFIRARLSAEKLMPAQRTNADTLRRRLAFVLTGLPDLKHSPTETSSDIAMTTNELAAHVDGLLGSPHFGERFARHWMDVVRYTDTYGYEWDNPAKGSHEYRDYLIRAFNDDIGFDRLLREQIAGDLLPVPRVHPVTRTFENVIAPMFFHMGEHRHGSSLMFNGIHQEMINNKIDAFSKAFLATTVACARCHDHKLEAVGQADYYALAAVFSTPRWTSRVADAPGKHDVEITRLKELRTAIRTELAAQWRSVTINADMLKASLGDLSKAKPTFPDVAYPLTKLAQRDADVVTAWTELQTEWRTVREQRQKGNAAFRPLPQFASLLRPASLEPTTTSVNSNVLPPPKFVLEGDGFAHGVVADATPLIALSGDVVVSRLLPEGLHSHALSSKLPGTLRMPPQHRLDGSHFSINLAGGEFGGYLVLDDHAFQNETVSFLNHVEPQWRSFADAALINGVQQVTVEFASSSLNPNFPPRTGIAPGLPNHDFGYDKRSWLSITGLVTHDVGGAPQDELDAFASLFDRVVPSSADDIRNVVNDWLTQAVGRWCNEKLQPGDRVIVDWLVQKKLLPNQAPANSKLASLVAEYREVESRISFPHTVNSMDERETTRAVYPLNVRGNVDVLGRAMAPDFLSMFADRHSVAKSTGSGRMEIADSLLQPEHPLTARVYVNRVWQWIFGTGLVATPDDFGRLGDRPSHPELLDWLAREFVREGWSTKKLVRRMVLSETFQQASTASSAARDADPQNRLLSHYPTRRLEAEALRDAMLAVSGRLDARLYGRPILPFRSAEDGSKRLFSGPLDGDGRRSLYLQMSIMEPPKFLVSFNLPDLKLPTGRRDVTNVPAQALVLLNDPFVAAISKHWATQLINQPEASPSDRLRGMFIRAFARNPREPERLRWLAALKDFSSSSNADPLRDELAWQQLAHAFFNSKEFLYYR